MEITWTGVLLALLITLSILAAYRIGYTVGEAHHQQRVNERIARMIQRDLHNG
jgi:hypothetical protein